MGCRGRNVQRGLRIESEELVTPPTSLNRARIRSALITTVASIHYELWEELEDEDRDPADPIALVEMFIEAYESKGTNDMSKDQNVGTTYGNPNHGGYQPSPAPNSCETCSQPPSKHGK